MNQPALKTTVQPKSDEDYSAYVNPQWTKLISMLGLNRNFVKSYGAELLTDDGQVFLDFLSGYGVYNVGHHHPYVTKELINELQSHRPTMLQSDIPTLAGELAKRLCALAQGRVSKVYFGSSGSEGIETAIKFSRSFTKRDWILYGEGGFHGLTCGALSLTSNQWWREGFGEMLTQTKGIPFGDIEALKREIKTEKYASFIIEPIQGEQGIIVPTKEYLKEAQAICDKHGTLFVIDEVQTGIHRTGPFLASHLFAIEPDMVILAKALSGGQVPVGALLMRSDISKSVYTSVDKAFVHSSTFSENALAMRAGLATLDVVENENLGARSTELGALLRSELHRRLSRFEMIKEIRGVGLFNAIEFQAPTSLSLKLLYHGFQKAHPGLFGQMVVKMLFEDGKILTQMAGNNYHAIKSLPPLTINEHHVHTFVQALERVCDMIVNEKTKFWSQGLAIGARAFSPLAGA